MAPAGLTPDTCVQSYPLRSSTSPGGLPARLLQVLHGQGELLIYSIMLAASSLPPTAVWQRPESPVGAYRECITSRLSGPGIKESKCPTCGQPGWQHDLQPDHTLHGICEVFRAHEAQGSQLRHAYSPPDHVLQAEHLRVYASQTLLCCINNALWTCTSDSLLVQLVRGAPSLSMAQRCQNWLDQDEAHLWRLVSLAAMQPSSKCPCRRPQCLCTAQVLTSG